jgi:hypothetical protein
MSWPAATTVSAKRSALNAEAEFQGAPWTTMENFMTQIKKPCIGCRAFRVIILLKLLTRRW